MAAGVTSAAGVVTVHDRTPVAGVPAVVLVVLATVVVVVVTVVVAVVVVTVVTTGIPVMTSAARPVR